MFPTFCRFPLTPILKQCSFRPVWWKKKANTVTHFFIFYSERPSSKLFLRRKKLQNISGKLWPILLRASLNQHKSEHGWVCRPHTHTESLGVTFCVGQWSQTFCIGLFKSEENILLAYLVLGVNVGINSSLQKLLAPRHLTNLTRNKEVKFILKKQQEQTVAKK